MLVGLLALLGFLYSTNYYELRYVDDELEPYVEEFVRECSVYKSPSFCNDTYNTLYATFFVDHDSALLNKNGGNIIGVSAGVHGLLPTVVYINRQYWEGASEVQRKLLMFHELSHSVLLQNHTCDVFSIMHAAASIPDKIVVDYWDTLVREMFIGNKEECD